MPPPDRESLPISALQHFAFCPRQCALIHVERQWTENTLTAEGRVLHDRAHDGSSESRGDLRIARSLHLQSTALGLHGVADVVEFHRRTDGRWQPFPVEYKRGRPKAGSIDAVQLCAQAICIEEMLSVAVPEGALFYGENHRRLDVAFGVGLREETARTAAAVHELMQSGVTPPPIFAPKCQRCSLLAVCQPQAVTHSASAHLARLLSD